MELAACTSAAIVNLLDGHGDGFDFARGDGPGAPAHRLHLEQTLQLEQVFELAHSERPLRPVQRHVLPFRQVHGC